MTIHALSPLDGRYEAETAPLRAYFSENAFVRQRVRVEVDYLIMLSSGAHLVRALTDEEVEFLHGLVAGWNDAAAGEVKRIEQRTRHDVKAIEYYLRERMASTSLRDVVESVHFGLTSEDVNLTAQALALREARDAIILPALDAVADRVAGLVRQYRGTVMLARTHGQAAVPTTLGKELAVFLMRIDKQIRLVREHRFEAKLTGAAGNLQALVAAAPEVDWLTLTAGFVRQYGLEPNLVSTQLVPYDNWLRYFDALRLANSILLDLAQDIWRYISDDYIKQRMVDTEVGSSTMPQKVNPIDFENAEGNLGLANALFTFYGQKLPVSRLQRDLSDSTVRRTFGVALGHSLLAYKNLARGLDKIQANEVRMRAELESHWDVVAEGAQTILRRAGVDNAYDRLKALTRGKQLDRATFAAWVTDLAVADEVKEQLRRLTPFDYIGLAEQLADRALEERGA